MAKKHSLKVKQLCLLRRPCHCQQVWAIVRGTPRKRLSVRCFTRGHLLIGGRASTYMTYSEIVAKERSTGGAP